MGIYDKPGVHGGPPKHFGRWLIVVIALALFAYTKGLGYSTIVSMIPVIGLVVLVATVWRKRR